MHKSTKISLLGKSYSIVTDQDPQVIERAAQRVEAMIRQKMEKSASSVNVEKIALIVALELATDLDLSNQKLEAWESKLESLSNTIDKNINI